MATTTETAPLSGPVPVDLPEAVEFLSESQWRVLMALMDTAIPGVHIQDSAKPTKDQDIATLHLLSDQYSEAAIKLRNAVTPLNPSSDVLEAYLAERPSDNPVFTQVLKCILTNIPPSKQKELRILLSILKYDPLQLPHPPH
jgi:hypothetical protein